MWYLQQFPWYRYNIATFLFPSRFAFDKVGQSNSLYAGPNMLHGKVFVVVIFYLMEEELQWKKKEKQTFITNKQLY